MDNYKQLFIVNKDSSTEVSTYLDAHIKHLLASNPLYVVEIGIIDNIPCIIDYILGDDISSYYDNLATAAAQYMYGE
jgi:hypothetical protein